MLRRLLDRILLAFYGQLHAALARKVERDMHAYLEQVRERAEREPTEPRQKLELVGFARGPERGEPN